MQIVLPSRLYTSLHENHITQQGELYKTLFTSHIGRKLLKRLGKKILRI